MGPRSYERGIMVVGRRGGMIAHASMGPRSYERGILDHSPAPSRANKLQWGRVLTNAESAVQQSEGLSVEQLQWGRVLTNAESTLQS